MPAARWTALAALLLLLPGGGEAHVFSVGRGEVHVNADRIVVRMEGDLVPALEVRDQDGRRLKPHPLGSETRRQGGHEHEDRIVEYRTAGRVDKAPGAGETQRKRIKALRVALQKKGWKSVGF